MDEEQTRKIDWAEEVEQSEARPLDSEQAAPHQDTPRPPSPYDQPVAYVSLGLTVGDGFKFGCGLMMAVVITLLVGLLVTSVALLLASLMGVPVPVGMAGPA